MMANYSKNGVLIDVSQVPKSVRDKLEKFLTSEGFTLVTETYVVNGNLTNIEALVQDKIDKFKRTLGTQELSSGGGKIIVRRAATMQTNEKTDPNRR